MSPPQRASPSYTQDSPTASICRSVSATPATAPAANIKTFEGDTSLSAYSTSTSDQLQRALRNTQLLQQDPDLAAALTSLSQIVSTQNEYPGEYEVPSIEKTTKSNRKYDIPPAEVVSHVLRECEELYDSAIGIFYPVRPYNEMVNLCKDLYFNIDDIPIPRLIVAFGSLYFIFKSYQFEFEKDDPRTPDYDTYTDMFVRNLMDLLGLLPVLMSPTVDNFEALLLGVRMKQDASDILINADLD